MSDIDPQGAAPPSEDELGAVRLIFVYEGDDVRLVSSHPVDVVVQPTDPDEDHQRRGLWVELRAASEEVIYRRVLSGPGRVGRDGFSPNPAVGTTMSSEPTAAGAFTVLVPRREQSSHVVLMALPPRAGGRRTAASQDAPASEVARFPLEQAGPARA